jgi:PepSY-associated TM region
VSLFLLPPPVFPLSFSPKIRTTARKPNHKTTAFPHVDKGAEQFRVCVHPQSLAIFTIDNEDQHVDVFTSRLHGQLLIGKYEPWIIELVGSWAVGMIVSGLSLGAPVIRGGQAAVSFRVSDRADARPSRALFLEELRHQISYDAVIREDLIPWSRKVYFANGF